MCIYIYIYLFTYIHVHMCETMYRISIHITCRSHPYGVAPGGPGPRGSHRRSRPVVPWQRAAQRERPRYRVGPG